MNTNRRQYKSISMMPVPLHRVEQRFLGGLLNKAKDAISRGASRVKEAIGALFSNKLPKSFRDTLEKNKDKSITNIQICREPLSKAVSTFANLISAGTFNEQAKKVGPDGFFHLYSIITLDDGTNLLHEFNERPVLQKHSGTISDKAECRSISGNNIPLGEFIEKAMKQMGEDKYIDYDAIFNNCQDHLLASLQANGLTNQELTSFIKQDTEDLIENTPAFSKILSKKATGLGGTLRQMWEELTAKKGGRIKRVSNNVNNSVNNSNTNNNYNFSIKGKKKKIII